MQLEGIQNIIFDLGDVIINIHPNNAIQGFRNLFSHSFAELEQDLEKEKILTKYETGEITTNDFISFFQTRNKQLREEEIITVWNSMLLDIPEERVQLIKKLSKQYRVFLLSNTNEIHLNFINNYVTNQFQLAAIDNLFEQAYYSHEMGLRKPNTPIFKTIIEEHQLIPEKTLFIDDTEEHIIGAKKLNLKTFHLVKPTTINDIF